MSRSIALLCVLHLLGNALLLWLGYYWLGIGEANGLQLAWSAFVILVFICSAIWLHGTALALFDANRESTLAGAARAALESFGAALRNRYLRLPRFMLCWHIGTTLSDTTHS